ncbi:Lrp/AsnC family transcriptional regulator [Pacificoceanicola onchidii]|uniref:Lrp/AsnC family transcriptional regulator n=1 Tax=Pacificoceanicola onchidii TaxID=2562685 RepID=UPI0010A63554|nr:Lrp/AsnC family transcriptional regulator [Pacificoceanicola onchidii]
MEPKLDEIDQRIIRELQRDGRLSHQDLSEKVGLSPSPCARRIKRLEAEGIIKGYIAQIDEQRMGYGMSVFVSVKLDKQVDDQLINFEKAIAAFPEVVDCWLMTGGFDYLLRVAVADLADFERFLTSRLTKVGGVSSIESSIPVRRVKDQRARIY